MFKELSFQLTKYSIDIITSIRYICWAMISNLRVHVRNCSTIYDFSPFFWDSIIWFSLESNLRRFAGIVIITQLFIWGKSDREIKFQYLEIFSYVEKGKKLVPIQFYVVFPKSGLLSWSEIFSFRYLLLKKMIYII